MSGHKTSEARFLQIGENFSVEPKLNQFIRVTVIIRDDGGGGSLRKVGVIRLVGSNFFF